MTNYANWKILKSVINYTGDDEEKQQAAQMAQEEYTNAAEWCLNNGYQMDNDSDYYFTAKIPEPTPPPPPTDEEIRQMREQAYASEVDGITAHIQRLRDMEQTEEVAMEISELIAERDAKVAEIKARYPYNEESANDEAV